MFRSGTGFAATTVIVILVMLAVFGIALVATTTTQQQSAVTDLQSARAYQAARAGAEFGVYQSLVNGVAGCTAANTTITLTGDLAGFRVTVACSSTSHTEAGAAVNMFEVAATGCNLSAGTCPAVTPPDANYVERQLRVTVGSN
jgi:MSHA biogenesis protein MshP